MNKNDKAYGLEDAEQLEASVRDVVAGVIECNRADNETWETAASRIKWPIEVHEHKRVVPSETPEKVADVALQHVIEWFDEDYADPDGSYTEVTDKMKRAATDFGKVFLEEYVPWAFEPTGKVIEVGKEEAWRLYSE